MQLARFVNPLIGTDYATDEPAAVPWVHAWAGAPTHTQQVLHTALTTEFGTGASGLPGNDDLGAISA